MAPIENIKEVKKELEIGNGPGYILSPGCDIPFNTPVENLIAIGNHMQGDFTTLEGFDTERQLIEEEEIVFKDIDIEPGKVFIEIVTLDSEGCAPCQYMCETVKKLEHRYGEKISWRETLIKTRAGINRMMKLKVKKLPAILINNEVVFDNIVPAEKELMEEIQKRI